MSGIEDLIGADVTAALDQAEAFRSARYGLISAVKLRLRPAWRTSFCLMRRIPGGMMRKGYAPPRGWRVERLPDRYAYLEMPLWLWAIRRAFWWQLELQGRGITRLWRAGLVEIEEGDYYCNVRPRGWQRLRRLVGR